MEGIPWMLSIGFGPSSTLTLFIISRRMHGQPELEKEKEYRKNNSAVRGIFSTS
jgi:hypothetical protein